jgi:hypothetical protein
MTDNLQRSSRISAWFIPAVLGLIVGYFAGREHLKYELRQNFQGRFATAFGEGGGSAWAEAVRAANETAAVKFFSGVSPSNRFSITLLTTINLEHLRKCKRSIYLIAAFPATRL